MEKNQFETLIVGAGLLGSSLAYHLTKLGASGVAVVDADLMGRLSSSELNAGGARATWDQTINVQLSQVSLDFLRAHPEQTGFRPVGYLWMFNEEQWPGARKRVEFLKKEHSINVEELSVGDLQKRAPFIDKTNDLAGATFSPQDGLFNPNLLKLHFREVARTGGVDFLEGHRVKSVRQERGGFTLVCERIPPKNENELKDFYEGDPSRAQKSSGETFSLWTRHLVNCAGPWASHLARMMGYESPVWAVRRQVSIFDVRDFDFSHYGMMVDPSGVYFHPEATNILGGYADHSEPKGWNLNYDGESFFQEKIWAPLFERSSRFEQLKHLTGWGGLYEMTPDKTAIVGAVPGISGAYEAHGFSGRGAMQSYGAGRGLAELMVHGRFTSLDLSLLSGDRFRKGQLIPEGLHI
jgi:glycine/D-amino acid oxidase-like deaminating enzyme